MRAEHQLNKKKHAARKETKKQITNKDWHNEDTKFAYIVHKIDQNHKNSVRIKLNEQERVDCVSVFEKQKEWFSKFPNILHIDATYSTMRIFVFILSAQNEKLKGLPVSYSFMKDLCERFELLCQRLYIYFMY